MTTLAEAQAKLAEYLAAESRILQAQEIRLDASGISRVERQTELAQVQQGIAQWQRVVDALTARAQGAPSFGGLGYSSANFGN